MNTKKLLRQLSKNFPKTIAKKYHDPVGLQTGKLKEETCKILLCLDFDEQVYNHFFVENNERFDLIITHHPFIFGTKAKVFKYNPYKKELSDKMDALDIPIYSYHTNFDEGKGGMNDALTKALGLKNIHPLDGDPMARGGELENEMNVEEFAKYAKERLNVDYGLLINCGNPTIKKVSIVGGGGWHTWQIAKDEGYDIHISGDIPHHARRDIVNREYNYLDLPHEIEKIYITTMKEILLSIDNNLEITCYDHEKCPKVI